MSEGSTRDGPVSTALVNGCKQVNEVSLERATHDEALAILRCAGEKVALLVKHYKASVPFLSPALCSRPGMNVATTISNSNTYKNVGLQEGEGRDNRQPCVVVQTSLGCGHYLCCQSEQELARLEAAWQRCTHNAVARLGSKTFPVGHLGQSAALTLDWGSGCFSLFDPNAKVTLWKYKFSQLKSSSDDGSSKVQLSFQEGSELLIKVTDYWLNSCVPPPQELECQSLPKLLCCMHAFLTAKLASVDPAFLSSSSSSH
ncbi:SNTG1 [Cordylochernes scorpioides]|uniref:SNTG1 n=1 Tax=Cordylochernes scorpioides TaxID=51811 RepID=A0ABY6JVK0_9ARAC|nr:SNTG1 [Cordylochernes scorpioides]